MEEPFQLPPAQASGGATIEALASGGVQVVGCAGLGAPVVLSPEEAALFRALFLVADGDGDGLLSPGESRAFLRRCLASEPAVARCHALAAAATAGGHDAAVGEAGWYVACRLCALAAAGVDLAGDDALPLVADGLREWAPPDFGDPPARPGAGGLIVKVMSPQLVGEGLQQFTQYAVRTRSTCAHYGRSEMRVLRRFSDFEWCRERLRRSRPGVVVPPLLSPKRWANNTSHDFVRERMESLTRFANRVVAHPKLRGSLEVQALLDASPAGLAAARALLDGADGAAEEETPEAPPPAPATWSAAAAGLLGAAREGLGAAAGVAHSAAGALSSTLKESLGAHSAYGPPGLEGSAASPLTARVAKLLPAVERARAAAEAVVRAKRAAAYEACRAGRYLALAGGAVDGAPGDEAEPQTAGGEPLGALVAALGAKVEAVGTCAQDHVDHEVAEFLEQLRYQKALMEAARDAAGDREAARAGTQRARRDLERAIQRLAAARAGGVDGSQRVHVATARLEAARAARDASVAAERAVDGRAGKESEIPNFKASYLGRFPLVLADFWTSDHLSERSRSVDAFFGTRARGTLMLNRS